MARATAPVVARTRAWPWASWHRCQLDETDGVGSLYIPKDVKVASLSILVVSFRGNVLFTVSFIDRASEWYQRSWGWEPR